MAHIAHIAGALQPRGEGTSSLIFINSATQRQAQMCSLSVSLWGCYVASWSGARSLHSSQPPNEQGWHAFWFQNQLETDQLSFFVKVRPYACTRDTFISFKLYGLSHYQATNATVHGDTRNGCLLRRERVSKIWRGKEEIKLGKPQQEGRLLFWYSFSVLMSSYLILLLNIFFPSLCLYSKQFLLVSHGTMPFCFLKLKGAL